MSRKHPASSFDPNRVYLYVHIFSDGRLYLLPMDEEEEGHWSDIQSLRDEIEVASSEGGVLLLSQDDSDEVTPLAEQVLEFIGAVNIDVFQVDPHPAVHGYYRSYAPYLEDAIEVAELDLEGTVGLLKQLDEEESLIDQEDLSGKLEIAQERVRLSEQLAEAKRALSKLKALHFEFCVDSEGLEQ